MKVGQLITHPTLGRCKIMKVHAAGTIDVRNIFTDRWYRISGLSITNTKLN